MGPRSSKGQSSRQHLPQSTERRQSGRPKGDLGPREERLGASDWQRRDSKGSDQRRILDAQHKTARSQRQGEEAADWGRESSKGTARPSSRRHEWDDAGREDAGFWKGGAPRLGRSDAASRALEPRRGAKGDAGERRASLKQSKDDKWRRSEAKGARRGREEASKGHYAQAAKGTAAL